MLTKLASSSTSSPTLAQLGGQAAYVPFLAGWAETARLHSS